MTRSNAFGWLVIVFGIAACVLLQPGCATTPARTVRLAWTACDGAQRDVSVEVRRAEFPPGACMALANELGGPLAAALVAVEVHAACTALRSDGRAAIMVLPMDASTWLVQHEVSRVIDHDTQRFRAWGSLPADCLSAGIAGRAQVIANKPDRPGYLQGDSRPAQNSETTAGAAIVGGR